MVYIWSKSMGRLKKQKTKFALWSRYRPGSLRNFRDPHLFIFASFLLSMMILVPNNWIGELGLGCIEVNLIEFVWKGVNWVNWVKFDWTGLNQFELGWLGWIWLNLVELGWLGWISMNLVESGEIAGNCRWIGLIGLNFLGFCWIWLNQVEFVGIAGELG